jgi:hypothetical protein
MSSLSAAAPAHARPAPQAAAVTFPAAFAIDRSPVYARNERLIAGSPERVWEHLVRAGRWSDWYANCSDLSIDGGGTDLSPGARFSWTTFGVRVHTRIEEFEPGRRLSWSGRGLGSTAWHGWVIEPCPGGCRVITEETQQGLIASLGRPFLRRGLLRWHQRWLDGLAALAEAR